MASAAAAAVDKSRQLVLLRLQTASNCSCTYAQLGHAPLASPQPVPTVTAIKNWSRCHLLLYIPLVFARNI